jgi:hypothetical protein
LEEAVDLSYVWQITDEWIRHNTDFHDAETYIIYQKVNCSIIYKKNLNCIIKVYRDGSQFVIQGASSVVFSRQENC